MLADALDPAVIMGPVVSEAACDRILGVIEEARTTGAGRVVTGGRRLDGDGCPRVDRTLWASVRRLPDHSRPAVSESGLEYTVSQTSTNAVTDHDDRSGSTTKMFTATVLVPLFFLRENYRLTAAF